MPTDASDMDPNPPPAKVLDEMLCFSIYKAHHAMNRFYKPVLAELGLTYPQFIVMMALWEEDGQTVGALGEILQLESNTLTPLLKRLEAAGLVQRRRSAEDERQVRVSLTEKGDALRAKMKDVLVCAFEAVNMPREEIAGLVREVKRVADAVSASMPE